MAWNYDTSLTADKDKVRLYIGDTISTIPLLSDEEIGAAITLHGDLFETAEHLCRALSARFGREAEIETDVLKDKKSKQAEHFLKLAEKYAEQTGDTASIVFAGGVDSTGAATGPFFTREMQLEGTLVSREVN